jgi:TRAP transporter TAXI family solute receptor
MRKKNSRKISALFVIALLFCVAFFGMSVAQADAETFLSIATGATAGTYYPIGVGLAQIITKYAPNVTATAETGNASAANINLIAAHKVELAIVQNDIAFRASQGESPFNAPVNNLRLIASLYPEHIQCVASKTSGIKTISGLKGKRVSVGPVGSGVLDSLSKILPVAGIKFSDMTTDYLDFATTAERIRDGQLDAGFLLAGYPTAPAAALAAQIPIDLVEFDDGLLSRLTQTYPFFVKDIIPAGTYSGVDHDTPTPAVLATLICDAALSDELVYNITKAIFDNLPELWLVHDKAKQISLYKALDGAAITVHPGAMKYYTTYTVTFNVTFNSTGGSSVSPQTVPVSGGRAKSPTAPTRPGHTFDGWYIDTDYTVLWDFNTIVTSDITLYAKWTPTSGNSKNEDSGGGCSMLGLGFGFGILALAGGVLLRKGAKKSGKDS